MTQIKPTLYYKSLMLIKNSNLVSPNDILLLGQDYNVGLYLGFGLLGAMLASKSIQKYVVAISDKYIKLFLLDSNGNFTNKLIEAPIVKIEKLTGKNPFIFRYNDHKYTIITAKKMFKVEQKEEFKVAIKLLSNLNTKIKERKRL